MFSNFFRLFILFAALLVVGLPVSAQSGLGKANGFFEEGAYREAIRRYERILKKNESLEAKLKLARAYRAIGELEKAEARFGEVVFDPQSVPEHKFELARLLKSMGKYEKARIWFEKYADESPDPALGQKWARSCEMALEMIEDSLGYQILPHEVVNSKASDISPVFYKSGIAFASARKRGFLFRSFNRKSKLPFYDLYFAQRNTDGRLKKPVYLRQNLNTRLHDGPAIFNAAESVAFITRSNTGEFVGKGVKGKRDANGFNRVNIYRVENKLDRWRKGEPVPFNSKEYNVAHPAVTKDGETLFFASDMPGGYGGTDLYVSYFRNEAWTKPENLGPEVNSEANDGYPFLSNDSTLYFASDRAEGFGGKDIFYARLRGGAWTGVRNAGYPLNSPADDFSFAMTSGSPYGFFATNRSGGKGDDDIVGFRRFKGMDGTVVDSRTDMPIPGAKIDIEDINRNKSSYQTKEDGTFRHYLRTGQEVLVHVTMDNYYDYDGPATLRDIGFDENLQLTIELDEIRKFQISGTVADNKTNKGLDGALVRIVGLDEMRSFAKKDGAYLQEIKPEVEYTAIYYKAGYVPKVHDLSTVGETEPKTYILDADLKPGRATFLEGRVQDLERGTSISEANIHIFDPETQQELLKFDTRKDGLFWKVLQADTDYSVVATKPNYLSTRIDIIQDSLRSDSVQMKLDLVPMEVNKVVKVIYHAYKEAGTNVFGRRDLNEIAYLLLDNPEISVELSSHTDSRGSAGYNKKLSQTRADAAARYLISRGVNKDRIIARGDGEEKLFNNCKDGRNCSEELHAQNRRTEIKIIRIDPELKMEKEEKNSGGTGSIPHKIKGSKMVVPAAPKKEAKAEKFISTSTDPAPQDNEGTRGAGKILPPGNEWMDQAKEYLETDTEPIYEEESEPGSEMDTDTDAPGEAFPGAKLF